MASFKSQILRHERAVNAAKARVRETVALRTRSDADLRTWQEACRAFHAAFVGDLPWPADLSPEGLGRDAEARAFVFDFLAVDPIYFRSGYIKETLLRQVKKIALTRKEEAVLRDAILRRVHGRAYREFRHFCRLIPNIQDAAFVSALRSAAGSEDAGIRRRAAFALRYVRQ